MGFQPHEDRIEWRVHFTSPPERVFDALDSDRGRASFWAEVAEERDGAIHFTFINGVTFAGSILERERPRRWSVEYFGSPVTFELADDGSGGTDLTMAHVGLGEEHRTEVTAGWLNVLLPFKAFVDHGVDLHNHDPERTWDQGYVDH